MMREIKIVRERFDDMVERAIQNQKLIEAGGRRQLLRGLLDLGFVLFSLFFFIYSYLGYVPLFSVL